MWHFFYKLGSPRWFYQFSGRCLPWLALFTALVLLLGVGWGLAFAPADFKQGNSFRIIYLHVPAASVAIAGYVLMGLAAAISLIWRIKLASICMHSCAFVGAVMALIVLATGSIWGKPTWGTWWVWDARMSSVVVLLFLYLAVLALNNALNNKKIADKACAVLSLVGLVNIPIIYGSVEWWYSLHQPATLKLTRAPAMAGSMLTPLLISLVGFYAFYTLALLLRMRSEILHREANTQWVHHLARSR